MKNNDVIFICHGNVNRSKMAEELLKFLRPDLKVDSFAVGVKSSGGKLITKKTRTVLAKNGVPFDVNNRSKVVTLEDIRSCKNVYVMDQNNIKHFIRRFGNVVEVSKLKLINSIIDSEKGIKDPGFSKGMDKYYSCFEEIMECCAELSIKL